jgi:hypothetical protein
LPRSPGPTRRASPLRAFDLSVSGIGPAVRRGRAAPPDRYWGTLRTAKLTGYEEVVRKINIPAARPRLVAERRTP